MKASNEAVYKLFNKSLIVEKHVLPSTRDVYLREVACFLTYLEDNSFDISTVSTTNLMDYLVYRSETKNLSSRTLAKVRTILKVFFGFINQEKIRPDDPTVLIPKNKLKKPLPETIDYEAVEQIFSFIDLGSEIGIRDRAIFELIYSCGLRVSECINLKLTDYYNREKRIIITAGKGDKQRMEPVGEMAIYYLDMYIEKVRPTFQKKKNIQQIFLNKEGEPLTRQQVWNRLKFYSEKAGVYSKVHTLRHSFATHMLKNGADLRTVQELLGHSDIRTTEIYTHVDTDKLLQEFEKAHPLGKKK